jgi:hypothetical protein
MKLGKKFLLLVLITVFVVGGLVLEPSKGSPSILRYVLSACGQFLIIFVSAWIGINIAKSFTLKSVLGKSILLISLGMLSWGIGALIWLYYNLASQTEVPYPSLADIGFLLMIPLSAYGLFLLLRNIKITIDAISMLKIVILPLLVFILTYRIFILGKLAENVSTLQKIFNILYPLGDAIFLSLTIVILSLIRGGKLFKPIGIICFGFIIEAIADFSFSWTTSIGTYYSGNWVDILFAFGFCAIGAGIYYTNEIER